MEKIYDLKKEEGKSGDDAWDDKGFVKILIEE